MRVVLDTNILVSALITRRGIPDTLYRFWRSGRFTLVSSEEQLEEFRRVTRYPQVRRYLQPWEAGTLLQEVRQLAVLIERLPRVEVSADPADNFLLAIGAAGAADYLVSGDRRGLLALERYQQTQIVSARRFLEILSR